MRTTNAEEQQTHDKNLELNLLKLYVKDLSFESPQAPNIFLNNLEENPKAQISIKNFANELDETHFEVVLMFLAEILNEDKNMFIIEIEYAGLFEVITNDKNMLDFTLKVSCPNTMFPYLRETIDYLTLKGGFPPMQLEHFDFINKYREEQDYDGKK